MGLYKLLERSIGTDATGKKVLSDTFSIYQFMESLKMGKEDAREARNILRQFHQRGYVQRISKNMYRKMKNFKSEIKARKPKDKAKKAAVTPSDEKKAANQ